MWFDPTFGTYFEPVGGGDPLSIEEVRALGPNNVVLVKATLPGWEVAFLELCGKDVPIRGSGGKLNDRLHFSVDHR